MEIYKLGEKRHKTSARIEKSKRKIVNFIKKSGGVVTFAQIAVKFGSGPNSFVIGKPTDPKVILWDNYQKTTCQSLFELLNDGIIHFPPGALPSYWAQHAIPWGIDIFMKFPEWEILIDPKTTPGWCPTFVTTLSEDDYSVWREEYEKLTYGFEIIELLSHSIVCKIPGDLTIEKYIEEILNATGSDKIFKAIWDVYAEEYK